MAAYWKQLLAAFVLATSMTLSVASVVQIALTIGGQTFGELVLSSISTNIGGQNLVAVVTMLMSFGVAALSAELDLTTYKVSGSDMKLVRQAHLMCVCEVIACFCLVPLVVTLQAAIPLAFACVVGFVLLGMQVPYIEMTFRRLIRLIDAVVNASVIHSPRLPRRKKR